MRLGLDSWPTVPTNLGSHYGFKTGSKISPKKKLNLSKHYLQESPTGGDKHGKTSQGRQQNIVDDEVTVFFIL